MVSYMALKDLNIKEILVGIAREPSMFTPLFIVLLSYTPIQDYLRRTDTRPPFGL